MNNTKKGKVPLKFGVVGVGHLGQHHARIYNQIEGSDLVGVASSFPIESTHTGRCRDTHGVIPSVWEWGAYEGLMCFVKRFSLPF